MFNSFNDLNFDYKETEEEDALIDSRPFSDGGIKYYEKRKRLFLDEWGSTYGKYKHY